MKKLLFAIGMLLALGIPAAIVGIIVSTTGPKGRPPERIDDPVAVRSVRDQLEERLEKFNKLLLQADYSFPTGEAARSLVFDATALKTHELYFKDLKSADKFVFVDSSGALRDSSKTGGGLRLKESGEILVNAEGTWLFLDGVPYGRNLKGWACYWAATKATAPKLTEQTFPRRQMNDSFMRTTLTGDNAAWRTVRKYTSRLVLPVTTRAKRARLRLEIARHGQNVHPFGLRFCSSIPGLAI